MRKRVKKMVTIGTLLLSIGAMNPLGIVATEVYYDNDLEMERGVMASELSVADIEAEYLLPEPENESVETQLVPEDDLSRELPNFITIGVTPERSRFKIKVTNMGVDRFSSLALNLKLYDSLGNLIDTKAMPFTNLKIGTTTDYWNISLSNTVQETLVLSGAGEDGGRIYAVVPMELYRTNFVGGSYGSMAALDGERHHMPSDSVNLLSKTKGPALRMVRKEHRQTASCGRGSEPEVFREQERKLVNEGKFLAAQRLGVNDVIDNFGSKYNVALNEMISYTIDLGYMK